MSKQSLMLSAAVAALFAGPAYATCTSVSGTLDCITTSTSTALTTGVPWTTTTVTTAVGTANVGSISIQSGSTVAISTTNIGAITINSNNYVYNVGAISNDKQTSATGILIDVSKNPNVSALSFTNAAGTTVTGAGVYLDTTATINLTGSGTAKHGIWLNAVNLATGTTGTYTGDITFMSGSTTIISGDSSQGVTIDSGATLAGNLTFGGGLSLTPTTDLSTTSSALYGVAMLGQVNGNIVLPSGGSIIAIGEGAQGMAIAGTGVNGSITIGGTLQTESISSTSTSLTNQNLSSKTIYPEAGTALSVGANVTNGIEILGTGVVQSQGAGPVVLISPSSTITAPFTIGVYTGYTANGDTYAEATDPGFSFLNRGSISVSPANTVSTTASTVTSVVGMSLSSSLNTTYLVLRGGIFNSGALSATITTTGTTAPAASAAALNIGSYTTLDDATYNTSTTSWNDPGTLTGKNGNELAALVNGSATGTGSITASVSGSRGGTATAITIASTANVPSLINNGTISATVTNSDATLDGSTNPVKAYAIVDQSGTLNSIYNTGTISATVSLLDNNSQIADAILLGDRLTGTTVRIDNVSTLSRSATITGNIYFGSGGTQIFNIQGQGGHSAAVTGDIFFNGTGTSGDQLWIGSYGSLSGTVRADNGLSVDIAQNGALALANTTIPLYATNLTAHGGTTPTNGGTLSLGVSNTLGSSGVISATGSVDIQTGSHLGVTFNSFVPQGSDSFVLITAQHGLMSVPDLASYNTSASTPLADGGSMPFLFASAELCGPGGACNDSTLAQDKLTLRVVPKTATGTGGLGLTGYAAQIFPRANEALANDDVLGAAMVNGIHNAAEAQAAYNAFAPNVTGGSRAIAISITDQGTGVVGARLRMLNLYGKQEGGTTLWGQEFFQMIKDPGRGALQADGTKTLSGFKDHGFGFALGIDGGSPKYGWYGGAFTFYAGDVGEIVRDSHTNEKWMLLSGYSAWRGKGLFFDSKIDVGYGHFDGKRRISLTLVSNGTTATYLREADNKHPGTMISGGFTTGGIFAYGAATLSPQISVDGLLMREEGYTEKNPFTTTVGDGFDLKVQPYYAKSLRVFLGGSVRYDLDLWDFYLQPEAHAGFRYDFFNDPAKLKAAFAYANTTGGTAGPGTQFTITGPDPSQGNYVVGGSLAATTDTWTLGVNFDFVRGTNGTFEQVGTINLLGRI